MMCVMCEYVYIIFFQSTYYKNLLTHYLPYMNSIIYAITVCMMYAFEFVNIFWRFTLLAALTFVAN